MAELLIVITVLSAFVISATNDGAARALVSRVMHVSPSSNGLAHVSLEPSSHTLGASSQQAGQSAQRSFTLQSAVQETTK